ncbi:MAG TPA: aldehyde dehydrogenase family protein [Acidimicrobiales bacterium]|nr:aldehyde dehydrogenase family protein [Acidimicrobiales bacterium]
MRTTKTSDIVTRLARQGHLIGSTWLSSDADGAYDHRYSATGVVQAQLGLAGAADVDGAVAAARAAQPQLAVLPALHRAGVLYRLADLLELHAPEAAELAALDNGTPVSVMNPGFYTAAWIRYYAGWCDKLDGEVLSADPGLSYVRLEPYGVIAVIPPWNGSMMGMGQKCGPALAAGNAIVAKPPEVSPFGMLRFAELALEAGLPPGVLNVVVGGATTGSALVSHPGVDKISFTGGSATARTLMESAARNLTPLALELGGKSPNIVFPDADLDTAAAMAAHFGTALLAGQGCALPTRLYVHDDVYDEVVGKVVTMLESIPVGDPLDPATFVGPVVTEAAMERILGVIDRARADGAALLAGGARLGGELAHGWFVAPTVFGEVDHDSDLARNEVFGPVQAVLRFTTEEEVLAKANDSAFGLGAYLHTSDNRRVQRFARELESGTVVVNGMGGISPATPFGGYKQSGFGREGGRAGIEEMVRRKTVFVSP